MVGSAPSFLALTDNVDRGVRVFQTLLSAAFEQPDLLSRFHFLEHALVLSPRREPTGASASESLHDPKSHTAAEFAWIEETARHRQDRRELSTSVH
jgi:hypothetical protein